MEAQVQEVLGHAGSESNLIFQLVNKPSWLIDTVYHLLVKNKWGWGGGGGLNREGGSLTFFPCKRGGRLIRGRGLFERGDLIEDLRYC